MAETITVRFVIRTASDSKIVHGASVDDRAAETIELVSVYDVWCLDGYGR
jgi:hypothetical protein